MIAKLFLLHKKQMVRSTLWKRNLGTNIFLGFLIFIMLLNFLSLSIYLDKIIQSKFPGINSVEFINQYIFYYLFIDLLFRMLFQKNHGMIVKPLLTLPISKITSTNFILSKSLFSIFNLFAIVIFVPFAIENHSYFESFTHFITWFSSIIGFVLFNCYLVVLLKRGGSISPKYLLLTMVLVGGPLLLNHFEVIDTGIISSEIFNFSSNSIFYIVAIYFSLIIVYFFNLNMIKNQLRLDKIQHTIKSTLKFDANYSFLSKLGLIGHYANLELKMLLRNKRSRATLMFSGAMILVGLIIYPSYSERASYASINSEHEDQLNLYQDNMTNEPNASKVNFKVLTNELPSEATIFISGNHQGLSNWEPDGVALSNSGNEWQRELKFAKGESLRYKVTLGSWKNQMLSEDGKQIEMNLIVNSDTTIVIDAVNWELGGFAFSKIMLVYMGILVTGMLGLGYGQFIFGWESSFFDLLCSQRINLYKYLQTKFILMLVAYLVFYLLSLAYGIISFELIKIHTSLFFYNAGVNSYMLFLLAAYNRKRLNLSASMLSTQGKGSSQYLAFIPVLIVPTGIIIPFAIYEVFDIGLVFLGALGLLGIIFQKPLLKQYIKLFNKQRYKLASGFRVA
jgi:hypothetical protein